MPYDTESRLFLGAVETVPGTAETLDNADANTRVREFSISDLSTEFDDEGSKFLTGDHTEDEAISGKEIIGVSFKVRATLGIIAGTTNPFTVVKLPYMKYLETSGLKSVFMQDVTATSAFWRFTPVKSQDTKTLTGATVDINEAGVATAIIGAGGMAELTFGYSDTAKPFVFGFNYKMKVSSVEDLLTVPEYSDSDGLITVAENATNTVIHIQEVDNTGAVVVGGLDMEVCAKSIELNTGNKLTQVECQADSSGIKNFMITSRKPRFKMNPVMVSQEDMPDWKMITRSRRVKITIVKYTDIALSVPAFKLVMPHCQITKSVPEDSDGLLRKGMEFRLLRNILGTTKEEKEQTFILDIYGTTEPADHNYIP